MKSNLVDSVSRVILVEDDQLLAAELGLLLAAQDNFRVVAQAYNLSDGMAKLSIPHDLLVVDIGLPDGSGIELVRRQQTIAPTAKSMVMTVFDDRVTTRRALAAGADGYVVKTDPNLLRQLELVVAGLHPIDPSVAGYLVDDLRGKSAKKHSTVVLTPREQQTLEALSEGLSYSEIAQRLEVSPHTITDYIKGVYRKLGVNSRSEAVYAGVHQGLVNF